MNLAVKFFRDMLADAPAFQTWTGTANQTAALARIHYEGLPDPSDGKKHTIAELTALRPYAIVYIRDQAGYSRSFISTSTFSQTGTIVCTIEQTAPSGLGSDPSSDANKQWANTIGAIIDGLATLQASQVAEYLDLHVIRLVNRGWVPQNKASSQGLFQRATLEIDF